MLWQLEQQQKQFSERDKKINELYQVLQETNFSTKKKSNKIKSLRKDRDQLRIDVLKLKQKLTEKCEQEREVWGQMGSREWQKNHGVPGINIDYQNAKALEIQQ